MRSRSSLQMATLCDRGKWDRIVNESFKLVHFSRSQGADCYEFLNARTCYIIAKIDLPWMDHLNPELSKSKRKQ